MDTVAGGGTVKRSPVPANTKQENNHIQYIYSKCESIQQQLMQNLFRVIVSPSITVCSVNVYAKIQQEFDYVVMSCTHGIVQRCDALIIGSARILHL